MKKILLSSPHIGVMERRYVDEAFNTNWLAPLGPHVDGFENDIKEYVNSENAVALTSGTAAIHMALKALRVKKGDLVFCSTFTFAATCNPIIYEKATPVFIDSEPDTWNMSPVALAKAFADCKKLPAAVIVVHLYGQPAKMDMIKEICDYYNVPIIEDAAESLGSTYKGAQTGAIGDYGIYSFNGNKIITTSGGGMLVSNNKEEIEKVRFWSTQSKDRASWYQHSELGYNYRMSNVLAGIGRGQMKVLDSRVHIKRFIYNFYKNAFKNIEEIEMMPEYKDTFSNHWLSCITLTDETNISPQDIMFELEKVGIESRRLWKPMHLQPYYKKYKIYSHFNHATETVSEDLFNRGLCLPSDTKMKRDEIRFVCKEIARIIKEYEKVVF